MSSSASLSRIDNVLDPVHMSSLKRSFVLTFPFIYILHFTFIYILDDLAQKEIRNCVRCKFILILEDVTFLRETCCQVNFHFRFY